MVRIVCKIGKVETVEIKKKYYENCCPGPSSRPRQHIKLHPTSCQFPLINYPGAWYRQGRQHRLEQATHEEWYFVTKIFLAY